MVAGRCSGCAPTISCADGEQDIILTQETNIIQNIRNLYPNKILSKKELKSRVAEITRRAASKPVPLVHWPVRVELDADHRSSSNNVQTQSDKLISNSHHQVLPKQ
ncbi:hypothetical protein KIN20_008445 [Parelaphostrongylus tenuis]|uniref:Uncharacterized protein n=1 Tax=Parelaphostrongylus tenuis TaxID=148309 RepID=A0AAD5M6W3_PARTN|nr:hypothetical protein KIN20_008445 [Parelaphostrongylus tenuis]